MDGKGTTRQEVMLGGLAGICSGYLFKNVSKYAAASAVVGYLVLQGASRSGYIKVNWKKVNETIEDIKEDIVEEVTEIVEDSETLVIENEGQLAATARKLYAALRENAATSGSFTGGFILGVLFA